MTHQSSEVVFVNIVSSKLNFFFSKLLQITVEILISQILDSSVSFFEIDPVSMKNDASSNSSEDDRLKYQSLIFWGLVFVIFDILRRFHSRSSTSIYIWSQICVSIATRMMICRNSILLWPFKINQYDSSPLELRAPVELLCVLSQNSRENLFSSRRLSWLQFFCRIFWSTCFQNAFNFEKWEHVVVVILYLRYRSGFCASRRSRIVIDLCSESTYPLVSLSHFFT